MPSPPDRLVRSLLWRSLWFDGREYCELLRGRDGWLLQGTAVAIMDRLPMLATYEIHCDEHWQTHRVHTSLTLAGQTKALSLMVEARGRWRGDAGELPALADCLDVDLGVTPATNTLPIRRLGLKIGDSRKITAAWIKFPELEVKPLPQTYTRLAEDRYRYESPGFAAEILVDDLGLVIDYKGAWERLAAR